MYVSSQVFVLKLILLSFEKNLLTACGPSPGSMVIGGGATPGKYTCCIYPSGSGFTDLFLQLETSKSSSPLPRRE